MEELTPIQEVNYKFELRAHPADYDIIEAHGHLYLKRDDLFEINGASGGKVRSCNTLISTARLRSDIKWNGIVTATTIHSTQSCIASALAKYYNMPCRIHTFKHKYTPPELQMAEQEFGAEIIQHKAGYSSQVKSAAKKDAEENNLIYIPFGMECYEAVLESAKQVENLPFDHIERIVVPIGSGMSIAGIMKGLYERNIDIPVAAIKVGVDPTKRIFKKFIPEVDLSNLEIIDSGMPYSTRIECEIDGITIDPIYEGKCLKFLQPNDLFWIVGIRACIDWKPKRKMAVRREPARD
jgi:1-aminocyclopropane-1-carboxylate deaminase/D-cysteine desulfhydrase-like pyridoxal-dependent ACC family enzyme